MSAPTPPPMRRWGIRYAVGAFCLGFIGLLLAVAIDLTLGREHVRAVSPVTGLALAGAVLFGVIATVDFAWARSTATVLRGRRVLGILVVAAVAAVIMALWLSSGGSETFGVMVYTGIMGMAFALLIHLSRRLSRSLPCR